MKKWGLLGLLAILPVTSALQPAGLTPDNRIAEGSHAQLLINTMFSERTPGFNDIYMIQTPDKGREILIYCNPSYCYKLKGHTVTA